MISKVSKANNNRFGTTRYFSYKVKRRRCCQCCDSTSSFLKEKSATATRNPFQEQLTTLWRDTVTRCDMSDNPIIAVIICVQLLWLQFIFLRSPNQWLRQFTTSRKRFRVESEKVQAFGRNEWICVIAPLAAALPKAPPWPPPACARIYAHFVLRGCSLAGSPKKEQCRNWLRCWCRPKIIFLDTKT